MVGMAISPSDHPLHQNRWSVLWLVLRWRSPPPGLGPARPAHHGKKLLPPSERLYSTVVGRHVMGSQPGAGSDTPKWETSGNLDSLTQTGTKTGGGQFCIAILICLKLFMHWVRRATSQASSASTASAWA